MRYIYGKDVDIEEHMLYSSEIAELFKIYNGKYYYGALVTQAIKDYVTINGIDDNNYFYNTRYGVKKVYPCNIYINAMKYMFANTMVIENASYYISLDNKKYKYERR